MVEVSGEQKSQKPFKPPLLDRYGICKQYCGRNYAGATFLRRDDVFGIMFHLDFPTVQLLGVTVHLILPENLCQKRDVKNCGGGFP